MTYVLDNEVVEELGELKIKLFEGNNYIYIKDEYNNHLCAEFVIKNDFTDEYVTNLQMSSAINQTAQSIDLSVNKKLEGYYTKEETEASIKVAADSIKSEVKGIKEEAIKNVDVMYALSTSETTTPTTGWSTNAPQWEQGKYMWQKTVTTLADDTVKESEPTCISGAKGDKGEQGVQGLQGEKGEQGIAGKDGISGKTSYFHIKYSSVANPTSSSQMSETPNTYIGTYVDFTEEDSTDPTKYTWTRFRGLQGAKGEQGIPGTNGANGISYYLHIKYSNDGQTFTSNNGETVGDYIGVRTDTNVNDSTNFSDYKWSKIKGNGAKKIIEQYYLSTSKTSQVGGAWKTIPDKWIAEHYMWTRSEITWTDNTVTYTEPILSKNTNEMYSQIVQLKNEVGVKLNIDDFTAAQILLMINGDESEAKISADKIDIDGKAVHFKTNISRTIGPFTQNDLNKIRDYIMEEGTLTQEEFKKYDVTGDNIISALDYTFAKKAMDNGGYLTFSGTYEINPNSENKSIALYDTRLQTYKAIISLLYNYFHALYVDDLEANSLNVTGKSGYLVAIDDDYNDTFEVVVNGIIKTPQGFVYATENLYDNESGTTGTVSLSENASNFEYIEIFYWDNNNASCHSTKVFNPNGKNVALFTLEGATNMYARSRNIVINGTSITNSQYAFASLSQGYYPAVDNTNYIKIYRVDGYR